ncbi:NAD(P)/FAD-dependent oxidoreductase [Actinomadura sp. 6N118]|uniref:NAD(P)/FAD-dependent oxidoreductase n=1 Tax=Actinomadura sp. 6N118 TaxID=3375151 RepID=UPI0037B9E1B0
MRTTVAIVGGGYGGITVAKALDEVTDVVLIEPRDTFVHNTAALRGLIDPQWTEQRLFLPYDRLLSRGQVIQDRAVRVDTRSITLASGMRIAADYIVLATGSTFPFPAKVDVDDSAAAKNKYRATHNALANADNVLLLGAGPVGLELAGEIKAAWADKAVTIVDPGRDIVAGDYPDEFRAELRRQLDALGVRLILGTSLREQPPSDAGEAKTFTATLHSGQQLTVDIWFRCFGVAPVTGYLADDLASARQENGHLKVTADLRLAGQQNVFAIGDITAIPEAKQAGAAEQHAAVVASNIRTLLHGGDELTTYQPGPAGIVLPLGPKGGATYAPGWHGYLDADAVSQIRQRSAARPNSLLHLDILDAEATSQFKGADLMTDVYAEIFGLHQRHR